MYKAIPTSAALFASLTYYHIFSPEVPSSVSQVRCFPWLVRRCDVASCQTVATSWSGCFSLPLRLAVSWVSDVAGCTCLCWFLGSAVAAELIISHSLSFRLQRSFCSVVRRSRATFLFPAFTAYHPQLHSNPVFFLRLVCDISACFMHF